MKAHTIITILIAAASQILSACQQPTVSFEKLRAEMVATQLEQRGITDPKILNAFLSVPREEFVLPKFKANAYDDVEAPIGHGQSIDRSYENAQMIEALAITPSDRVLEVGTGSGYLATLMSKIAKQVYTIEIEADMAEEARGRLKKLGITNVEAITGDGFAGLPALAPFDAIVLTCSPDSVPRPLIEQLAEGGRLLLPLGGVKSFQELVLYKKVNSQFVESRRLAPTTFVPMKGKVLEGDQ